MPNRCSTPDVKATMMTTSVSRFSKCHTTPTNFGAFGFEHFTENIFMNTKLFTFAPSISGKMRLKSPTRYRMETVHIEKCHKVPKA